LCGNLTLLLAGLLPGLAACTRAPATPLRVAAHVWPGYELMFLAQREGWLVAHDVTLVQTVSATASQALLAAGQVDAAALTLDEVLRLRSAGQALTIPLVFDESAGADAVVARPALRTLADLAGQRVGVETTALGAYLLHRVLEKAGLPAAAVTVVPVKDEDHLAAWDQQKLAALLTYEPTIAQLEARGAHRLFDSRQLPGEILDVLAVRSELLVPYTAALTALTTAHFRALRHLRSNPHDAAYRMAERLQLPTSEVLRAFRSLQLPNLEANRQQLASAGSVHATAVKLAAVMTGAGLLPRTMALDGLVTTTCLPERIA
jgi:NitT/TauT family transport system substrate-binding protein